MQEGRLPVARQDNTAHGSFLAGLGSRIHPIRAFRRARDGAAKGRVCWELVRWLDAKFEVTSARSDLRNTWLLDSLSD